MREIEYQWTSRVRKKNTHTKQANKQKTHGREPKQRTKQNNKRCKRLKDNKAAKIISSATYYNNNNDSRVQTGVRLIGGFKINLNTV